MRRLLSQWQWAYPFVGLGIFGLVYVQRRGLSGDALLLAQWVGLLLALGLAIGAGLAMSALAFGDDAGVARGPAASGLRKLLYAHWSGAVLSGAAVFGHFALAIYLGRPTWERTPSEIGLIVMLVGGVILDVVVSFVVWVTGASSDFVGNKALLAQQEGVELEIEPPLPPLPRRVYWPSWILSGLLAGCFALQLSTGGWKVWGLSVPALEEGRYETIPLHMFAHGGLVHLTMNVSGILALVPVVMAVLGTGVMAWMRMIALYFAGGLMAAATFLVLHEPAPVPMVGASGAIFALAGVFARLERPGLTLRPIRSKGVWQVTRDLIIANIVLFVLLYTAARAAGSAGGLAWEGHLGGYVFGLLVAPWFVHPFSAPRVAVDAAASGGVAA